MKPRKAKARVSSRMRDADQPSRLDLDSLALSLVVLTRLAPFDGPWEVSDWDDEEGVAVLSLGFVFFQERWII